MNLESITSFILKRLVLPAIAVYALAGALFAQNSEVPETPLDTISPLTLGAASAGLGAYEAVFFNAGAVPLRYKLQWDAFYDRSAVGKSAAGFFYSRRAFYKQQPFTWGGGAWYHYRNLVPQRLPAASSDDFILLFSLGKTFQRKNYVMAIGFSQKYWVSHFAQFSATSFLWDAGGVLRSKPVDLWRNAKGAASLGFAVSHLGSHIVWEGRPSEMPMMLRSGGSFTALWNDRHYFKFFIDYQHSARVGSFWGLGTEIDLLEAVQLRAMRLADFHGRQKWFLGLGVSLRGKQGSKVFAHNDGEMQIDATVNLSGDHFEPAAFACSYLRKGPDPFALLAPVSGDTLGEERSLHWQPAFDADWLGSVVYRIVFDSDSARIAAAIRNLTASNVRNMQEVKHFIDRQCKETYLPLPELSPGVYYWAAAAMNRRGYVSPSVDGVKPEKVLVPQPKALLKQAEFIPTVRLSNDALQGKIVLSCENFMEQEHAVKLSVTEKGANGAADFSGHEIRNTMLRVLPPGRSEIELPWRTEAFGRRELSFALEPVYGRPYAAKPMTVEAITVPRVRLEGDSLKTVRITKRVAYLPLLRSVSFKRGSSELCEDYQTDKAVQPVIRILAERLKAYPKTILHIEGMIDPDSGEEELSLAWQRARVVRDLLVEAGVDTLQMRLHAFRNKKRNLPPTTKDLEWILEERRCVRFSAASEDAGLLFAPIQLETAEAAEVKLNLSFELWTSLPLIKLLVEWQGENGTSGVYLLKPEALGEKASIQWILSGEKAAKLAGSKLAYRIAMTDSLGRVFRSDFLPLRLESKEIIAEHIFYVPFDFAKDTPDSLGFMEILNRMTEWTADWNTFSLQISGSSCPIGDPLVNKKLAERRAEYVRRRLLAVTDNRRRLIPLDSDFSQSKDPYGQSNLLLFESTLPSSPAQRQLLRFAKIRCISSAAL